MGSVFPEASMGRIASSTAKWPNALEERTGTEGKTASIVRQCDSREYSEGREDFLGVIVVADGGVFKISAKQWSGWPQQSQKTSSGMRARPSFTRAVYRQKRRLSTPYRSAIEKSLAAGRQQEIGFHIALLGLNAGQVPKRFTHLDERT